MAGVFMCYEFWAETPSGRSMHVLYKGGDPYYETARMGLETALCLVEEREELRFKGGVLTPATACGGRLQRRMCEGGMEGCFGNWCGDSEAWWVVVAIACEIERVAGTIARTRGQVTNQGLGARRLRVREFHALPRSTKSLQRTMNRRSPQYRHVENSVSSRKTTDTARRRQCACSLKKRRGKRGCSSRVVGRA